MSIWAILALGVGPGIFWLFYFYSKDRLEPEPKHMVLLSFFLGGLAALPIAIAETVVASVVVASFFFIAVFIAPVVEEIGKYLTVRWTVYKSSHFDEPMDGIVYGVAGALGFASVENVIYLISAAVDAETFWTTAAIRAVLSVPGHALFSALWGYALGWSILIKDTAKRLSILSTGLLLSILFHGLFNFSVVSGGFLGLLSIVLLILLVFIAWKTVLQRIDHALKHSPHAPENQGESKDTQNRLRL